MVLKGPSAIGTGYTGAEVDSSGGYRINTPTHESNTGMVCKGDNVQFAGHVQGNGRTFIGVDERKGFGCQ